MPENGSAVPMLPAAPLPPKPFAIKDHINRVVVEESDITTIVVGRTGVRKLLRYDLKNLVRKGGFASMFNEGTVFTMDNTASSAILVFLCIMAASCLVTVGAHSTNFEALKDIQTAPLEQMAACINSFVPFVLALYVSLSLTRWWQLRVIALGKVFDAFASISMLLNSELHERKWNRVRTQVAKYGFASVELIMQAAQANRNLESLVQQDMLTPKEIFSMETQDLWQRPIVVWSWIMRICVASMEHNYSPPPRIMGVMNQCLNARQGIANINTYLDTQLPFAYVHLITLLVNVQNVTLSAKCGIVFAKSIGTLDAFVMVQQVALCVIVCFIYQALLQISYVLMDPFGDDILDFPCTAYMEYLAAHIDAMAEAQGDCPVVAQDGSIYRPQVRAPDIDSFTDEGD